jgi:hypothetical protein
MKGVVSEVVVSEVVVSEVVVSVVVVSEVVVVVSSGRSGFVVVSGVVVRSGIRG